MMTPRELIELVVARYGAADVARTLGSNAAELRNWRSGSQPAPPNISRIIKERMLPPPRSRHQTRFRFIDLFAGIGGMRRGFESVGGECVFTCERNPSARKTYAANFHDVEGHVYADDITTVDPASVPDHEVLLAGFPCQPFSSAGVSKKNSLGRPHGFEDKTQGTLFFNLASIIAAKKPQAFLLENVENLKYHNKGETLQVILDVLKNDLGYEFVEHRVIDAARFVPQHRERLYIVGFRDKCAFSFDQVKIPGPEKATGVEMVLHGPDEDIDARYLAKGRKGQTVVREKYTLGDLTWACLKRHKANHEAKGNGFGYGEVKTGHPARTLSHRYGKDGAEILVKQRGRNPRRLTPRECARLMGFDEGRHLFRIPVSDAQAYMQFGNAVVVPVIRAIAEAMVPYLPTAKSAAFDRGK
jgi:DNA (cytosine-5)-methyltransferase 1